MSNGTYVNQPFSKVRMCLFQLCWDYRFVLKSDKEYILGNVFKARRDI